MAKQTGPMSGVKSAAISLRIFGALLGVLALSGCADDRWSRPDKTAAETAADYKACNDRAQDAVLTHAGQDRATYGSPSPTAQPGNPLPTGEPGLNLGETPMQLHDRVVTEQSFDKMLATCMTDKGYTTGKPKPGM